jgi:hypothetical protein
MINSSLVQSIPVFTKEIRVLNPIDFGYPVNSPNYCVGRQPHTQYFLAFFRTDGISCFCNPKSRDSLISDKYQISDEYHKSENWVIFNKDELYVAEYTILKPQYLESILQKKIRESSKLLEWLRQ